jgi:hypothetical protein
MAFLPGVEAGPDLQALQLRAQAGLVVRGPDAN